MPVARSYDGVPRHVCSENLRPHRKTRELPRLPRARSPAALREMTRRTRIRPPIRVDGGVPAQTHPLQATIHTAYCYLEGRQYLRERTAWPSQNLRYRREAVAAQRCSYGATPNAVGLCAAGKRQLGAVQAGAIGILVISSFLAALPHGLGVPGGPHRQCAYLFMRGQASTIGRQRVPQS